MTHALGETRRGHFDDDDQKTKNPAESRGVLILTFVKRNEAFRPWQAWQRPTLPSLET